MTPECAKNIRKLLDAVVPAIGQLTLHQKQLDADGCMVGVSRQAVDEVCEALNNISLALTLASTTPDPTRAALEECVMAMAKISKILKPFYEKTRPSVSFEEWCTACDEFEAARAKGRALVDE